MTKNKKRVLIASAAVIVAALSLTVGITLSYLGKTTDKKNTIKVGYGDVEISEKFSEPSEMSMVNPNIEKKIYVQNKSTVPAFARVYAEFSDSKIADQAKVTYTPKTENAVPVTVTWAQFKTDLAEGNTVSDWVYVAADAQHPELEGYFYYTKALDAKTERLDNEGSVVRDDQNNIVYDIASTPKLFDSVTIDYKKYNDQSSVIDGSNTDRIVPVEMIVYSELVQTVETGSTIVTSTVDGQQVESTVYGYDYGAKNEWKEVWEHFLK